MGRGEHEQHASTQLAPRITPSERRRALAAVIADQTPRVEAAALFGSAARGEATDGSDLDLLLVYEQTTTADPAIPEHLLDQADEGGIELSPVPIRWRRVEKPVARFWILLSIVEHEGQIVKDPGGRLQRLLGSLPRPTNERLRRDTEYMLPGLDARMADRASGDEIARLADCYRMAKGAAVNASVIAGDPQVRRVQALAWLAARHPELASDIGIIQAAQPAYEHNMGRIPQGSPSAGELPAVQQAYQAAREIINGVMSSIPEDDHELAGIS